MRQSWVVAGLWSLLEGCPHTPMASPPGKWSVVFFTHPSWASLSISVWLPWRLSEVEDCSYLRSKFLSWSGSRPVRAAETTCVLVVNLAFNG